MRENPSRHSLFLTNVLLALLLWDFPQEGLCGKESVTEEMKWSNECHFSHLPPPQFKFTITQHGPKYPVLYTPLLYLKTNIYKALKDLWVMVR